MTDTHSVTSPQRVQITAIRTLCGSSQYDISILLVVSLLCVVMFFLFSDLKGIWTDEGFRIAIMNGWKPFSDRFPDDYASWSAVIEANKVTMYQPLYYIVQNTVMRIARTHDLVILRSVNIFALFCISLVLMYLSRGWPLFVRIVLIASTLANGYVLMHVLQIREYTFDMLWFLLVVSFTLGCIKRNSALLDRGFFVFYISFGIVIALSLLNSLLIVPSLVAVVIFILLFSRRRLPVIVGLSISAVTSILIIGSFIIVANYWAAFLSKFSVPLWITGDEKSIYRLSALLVEGLNYSVTGFNVSGVSWLSIGIIVPAVCGLAAAWFGYGLGWRCSKNALERSLFEMAMLCVLILGARLTFQVIYFIKKDALSLWARYFMQQSVALHLLMVTALCMLFVLMKKQNDRCALPILPGMLGAALIAVLVTWSVGSTMEYYQDPYADTAMWSTCNWRRFSTRLQSVVGDKPILFYRYQEASTVTASTRFQNISLIWQYKMEHSPQTLPDIFFVVNHDFLTGEEEALQSDKLKTLGYRLVEEGFVASEDDPSNPSCRIRSRIVRAVREGQH